MKKSDPQSKPMAEVIPINHLLIKKIRAEIAELDDAMKAIEERRRCFLEHYGDELD